mmetsp:Transcript_60847/g.189064  ORF Transcript_60847/g.189064 Transcript_60847/m.189064 type:complete len:275 (+) Transcript_60847:71-895(+)
MHADVANAYLGGAMPKTWYCTKGAPAGCCLALWPTAEATKMPAHYECAGNSSCPLERPVQMRTSQPDEQKPARVSLVRDISGRGSAASLAQQGQSSVGQERASLQCTMAAQQNWQLSKPRHPTVPLPLRPQAAQRALGDLLHTPRALQGIGPPCSASPIGGVDLHAPTLGTCRRLPRSHRSTPRGHQGRQVQTEACLQHETRRRHPTRRPLLPRCHLRQGEDAPSASCNAHSQTPSRQQWWPGAGQAKANHVSAWRATAHPQGTARGAGKALRQ